MVRDFRTKLFMDVLIRAANFTTANKVVHRFFDEPEEARLWLRDMRRIRGGV